MNRGERRARTIALGRRRRKAHLKWAHGNDVGKIDCVCDLSNWRFAKRKGRGCEACRTHPRGRPKISTGLCKSGKRTRIYIWRRTYRYYCHAIVTGALDPLDDDFEAIRCRGI